MTESKTILVINAIFNREDMAEVQSYMAQIGPVFDKNGGKTIARYDALQQVAGTDGPEVVAVVEFPSPEAINAMVVSDDFTSLADLRARVFKKLNLTICEEKLNL
jgi:uncharacterized protein (DUF1330 family)